MDPTTVYGISKLAGEGWCAWYHRNHGVDVRSLRYPGLISWKTRPGGGTTDYAVEIFHAALLRRPLHQLPGGRHRLPMMYMPDAIRATLALMDAPGGCGPRAACLQPGRHQLHAGAHRRRRSRAGAGLPAECASRTSARPSPTAGPVRSTTAQRGATGAGAADSTSTRWWTTCWTTCERLRAWDGSPRQPEDFRPARPVLRRGGNRGHTMRWKFCPDPVPRACCWLACGTRFKTRSPGQQERTVMDEGRRSRWAARSTRPSCRNTRSTRTQGAGLCERAGPESWRASRIAVICSGTSPCSTARTSMPLPCPAVCVCDARHHGLPGQRGRACRRHRPRDRPCDGAPRRTACDPPAGCRHRRAGGQRAGCRAREPGDGRRRPCGQRRVAGGRGRLCGLVWPRPGTAGRWAGRRIPGAQPLRPLQHGRRHRRAQEPGTVRGRPGAGAGACPYAAGNGWLASHPSNDQRLQSITAWRAVPQPGRRSGARRATWP
jgi:hypothetical protein